MIVLCAVVCFIASRRASFIAAALGLWLWLCSGSVWMGLAGYDLAVGVRLILLLAARRRSVRSREGLPELAEAAGARVGSGLTLDEAVESGAHLVPGIGSELEVVLDRMRRGTSLPTAVEPLRSHEESDVRYLGATLELAGERVSDAEATLVSAARIMRERRLRLAEVSAQASQSTASAMLMALIPLGGIGVAAMTSSGVFDPRLGSESAALVVLGGLGLSLTGSAWSMALIARTEVGV